MQPYSQQQTPTFRSPQKQYPRLDMVGGKMAYYGTSSPPGGSGRKYHDSTGTYSETESEPEPLPFCSCDDDYFVRCEYHRGEHHGLSFELAHDFVDLKHLLRTIQEQEVRRYVYQGTQVGKVIEFLTLRHFQMNEIQLNSLTRLIHDKMAHVRQIHLIDTLDANFIHQHRVAFRRFCTAIFAVHPVIKYNSMAAELPEEQRGLVKEIAVRECPMDNTFFASIGSAMHYSNTVQNIDLQELMDPAQVKEEDLHLCWGWLVYGLFHPNSTARIEKLDLSRNMMRMKDIRVVEGIMSGGHPALVLLIPEYAAALQRYSKSNRDKILREDVKRALLKGIPHRRVFALIKKGTTVRPLPTSKLSQHEVYSDLLAEKELLEVFCILRKWLCVVVPGFGLGWVPRQSAIEMTEIGMSPRICSPATLMRSVSFWNMIEASDAEGMVVPLVTLFFQMTGISDRLEEINLSENRIGRNMVANSQLEAAATSETNATTNATAGATATPLQKRDVYLTGFGKFGDILENPTTLLARKLAEHPKVTESHVLKVSAESCVKELSLMYARAEERGRPCIFLHFGVSATSRSIKLEQVGYNMADFRIPDERGYVATNEVIHEGEPPEISTKLPLEEMLVTLQAVHPRVDLSVDPGRYICNYVYYRSLVWAKHQETKGYPEKHFALFVHVPEFRNIVCEDQVAVAAKIVDLVADL